MTRAGAATLAACSRPSAPRPTPAPPPPASAELARSSLITWHVDLGLGLGLPVQVLPTTRPGVRVLGRLGGRFIHILGVHDA